VTALDPRTSTLVAFITQPVMSTYNDIRSQRVNQMSVFSGKSNYCRTDLHDARTSSSIPKNIYPPIKEFLQVTSEFTQLCLLKFVCKSGHIPRRYGRLEMRSVQRGITLNELFL